MHRETITVLKKRQSYQEEPFLTIHSLQKCIRQWSKWTSACNQSVLLSTAETTVTLSTFVNGQTIISRDSAELNDIRWV